jgi:hypothetical protein
MQMYKKLKPTTWECESTRASGLTRKAKAAAAKAAK